MHRLAHTSNTDHVRAYVDSLIACSTADPADTFGDDEEGTSADADLAVAASLLQAVQAGTLPGMQPLEGESQAVLQDSVAALLQELQQATHHELLVGVPVDTQAAAAAATEALQSLPSLSACLEGSLGAPQDSVGALFKGLKLMQDNGAATSGSLSSLPRRQALEEQLSLEPLPSFAVNLADQEALDQALQQAAAAMSSHGPNTDGSVVATAAAAAAAAVAAAALGAAKMSSAATTAPTTQMPVLPVPLTLGQHLQSTAVWPVDDTQPPVDLQPNTVELRPTISKQADQVDMASVRTVVSSAQQLSLPSSLTTSAPDSAAAQKQQPADRPAGTAAGPQPTPAAGVTAPPPSLAAGGGMPPGFTFGVSPVGDAALQPRHKSPCPPPPIPEHPSERCHVLQLNMLELILHRCLLRR
jgi:hypothetical protein